MTSRPAFIVSSGDLPERTHTYPHSEERMGPVRSMGKAAGLVRIGVNLQRLPPGTRSSWPHAEEDEEEFVYVIEGVVDAWIDGDLHRIHASATATCLPAPPRARAMFPLLSRRALAGEHIETKGRRSAVAHDAVVFLPVPASSLIFDVRSSSAAERIWWRSGGRRRPRPSRHRGFIDDRLSMRMLPTVGGRMRRKRWCGAVRPHSTAARRADMHGTWP